jgi:hypothetical protein
MKYVYVLGMDVIRDSGDDYYIGGAGIEPEFCVFLNEKTAEEKKRSSNLEFLRIGVDDNRYHDLLVFYLPELEAPEERELWKKFMADNIQLSENDLSRISEKMVGPWTIKPVEVKE